MRTMIVGTTTCVALFVTSVALAQTKTASVADTRTASVAQPPPSAGVYPPAPPGPAYPEGYYPAPPRANPEERTAMNGLYIEGLGPGLFYAVNYDRTISDFAVRVGISYISLSANSSNESAKATFLAVPLTASYLGLGSKKHIFEIGAGATIVHVGAGVNTLNVDSTSSSSGSTTTALGVLILGYRLQPPDGGFMLRTGISPLIGNGGFLPWPYIALGAVF